ncbi:MAG TPA: hypothetical protein VKU94_06865, partial [Geobacterales bacterium]|nr:hypothetical protein [Geobacterales bacterium]
LRFWLEETPIYKDYAVKGEVATSPVVDVFRKAWKPFAIILIIQSGQAAVWYTGYIATFTTFWLNIAKIPYITTLTMFALIYFVVAFLYPLSGILGDRYGRRSLFTWPLTIAAITIVPLLYLFAMTKNLAVLSLSTIFILTPAVITNAAWAAAYLELLPANIRISGFNIAYQLATAVFGGFLPYIITALLQITNNVAISASYIAALAAMSAIVSWKWLPETKNVDLRKTV